MEQGALQYGAQQAQLLLGGLLLPPLPQPGLEPLHCLQGMLGICQTSQSSVSGKVVVVVVGPARHAGYLPNVTEFSDSNWWWWCWWGLQGIMGICQTPCSVATAIGGGDGGGGGGGWMNESDWT